MYEFIKGRLYSKGTDHVIIECGGIGYKIYTTTMSLASGAGTEKEITMFTHLHIREGIMDLYGFANKEELSVFRLLITVSGVGPKAALSILGTLQPARFGLAVAAEDVQALSKSPGIGKKTAQRIILELKDKLKKAGLEAGEAILEASFENAESNNAQEALNALLVLGYTQLEARKSVSAAAEEGDPTEVIIRKALKFLSRS